MVKYTDVKLMGSEHTFYQGFLDKLLTDTHVYNQSHWHGNASIWPGHPDLRAQESVDYFQEKKPRWRLQGMRLKTETLPRSVLKPKNNKNKSIADFSVQISQ